MEERNKQFSLSPSFSILLGAVLISFSILLSGGVIKIGSPTATVAGIQTASPDSGTPGQPAVPAQPATPLGPTTVSIDDDPVLGDKNAPITIVEFSDYECPFCKRHYDQTYIQLKKDYIDTGKVKLVFRDLPLSFHDPLATTEAIAANCAREQGGDTAYFNYHDELFKRTTSNGNGLTKDNLYTIATDLGLNSDNLKSCVEAEKYKDEVKSDLSYASSVGANGTPTFFIGKEESGELTTGTIDPTSQASSFKTFSDDNKLLGAALVGAQPYSEFKAILDELLK